MKVLTIKVLPDGTYTASYGVDWFGAPVERGEAIDLRTFVHRICRGPQPDEIHFQIVKDGAEG